MDNRGIALKRKRGGERVTVGKVEEAMGQSGFVPDLQDDLGNLGRETRDWTTWSLNAGYLSLIRQWTRRLRRRDLKMRRRRRNAKRRWRRGFRRWRVEVERV
uniref:Uncharacterized protein n=1 Tax=Opuntia streptacantha TaxID=393608 RepID=A0A7C9EBK9_OPUST